MSLEKFDEWSPVLESLLISSTEGTAVVNGLVAAGKGKRYDVITVASDDTVDHVLAIHKYDGTNLYLIGRVTVPLGAGQGTVAIFDALAAILPAGAGGVVLPTGYSLRWQLTVALTAGKFLNITLHGGTL